MTSYCQDLFGDDKNQNNRCMRPHIYCRYQCDSVISPIEKLINYKCYADCIRQIKIQSSTALPKPAPQENFITWQPKLGAKCDYKPSGHNTFVPCVVKQIKDIGTSHFTYLTYQVLDGSQRLVWVATPSPNLLECGKGLKIRTDCQKP